MVNEGLPQPTGISTLLPVSLNPEQEELCKRLDELHDQYRLKVKPSEMFRGAVFASRIECRTNPDWISQAANSLREILYPLSSRQVGDNMGEAFKKYGSILIDESVMQEVGRVYGRLQNLAHHRSTSSNVDFANFTASEFEQLLAEFERVMQAVLTRQIDLHTDIDKILSGDPEQTIWNDPKA